ncbi:hypothetical protein Leryth_020589 [Lithospermum erythrorhizon]|nr:hypothetical protein Leryth_020589 [Lithospermum erythrorhizon]
MSHLILYRVTKPIRLPKKTKPCSYLILQHDFGFTYGKPPVLGNYTPPFEKCPCQDYEKIVLVWRATCRVKQFDRIFGVWLGGVELLRSCTAEPTKTGIVWSVEKDVTRYYSLLMSNQTLAVYIGNVLDDTYTGVYHVKIYMHFYPKNEDNGFGEIKMESLEDSYHSNADLIYPISRSLPLNDGLWFEIVNASNVESKEVVIPQNVYRAVLEVYVSFHENDEFWYGNYPNEYISASNLKGAQGNGPFREVVVALDDHIVGAVWPFPVVYTGGVNPLFWRPITGIGSFDLPSYDIEITPFLGMMLDGKSHKFGFSVTNALNVWYIDANLHLWLDKGSEKTEGKLLNYNLVPLQFYLASNFTGYDGSFHANVSRSIKSTGFVKSSHGTITTEWAQDFNYSNIMTSGNEGNMQIVKQNIHYNDNVNVKSPSSVISFKSLKSFPFFFYTDIVDQVNGTYTSLSNVTLGFNEKKVKHSDSGASVSSLKNLQSAQGDMVVKGDLVVRGLGSTQQLYRYHGNEFCYFRNISSSNYTILYDKERYNCGLVAK